jgi:VIT1/CCC1 family predicted Fe2+/Mn2+ transporter
MKDELEMIPDKTSPRGKAIATFVSFNLIGLIPLVFYILAVNGILLGNTFVIASIATAIGFIFIGMLKSYVNKRSIVRGIMETLLLGGVASVVAYFVGDVLEKLV